MPQSIPYSPALALGNLVPPAILTQLEAIASVQAPVDEAQAALNRMIALDRSLDMTATELTQAGVELSAAFNTQVANIKKAVNDAAVAYGAAAAAAAPQLARIGTPPGVNDSYESPLDYVKTQIKRMPLSADSLQANAQYFSFDQESQSAQDHIDNIKGSIGASLSYLGDKYSTQITTAVQNQMSQSHELHSLDGTLVLSASTTQQDAVLLAPCVIDVDKAIDVWNAMGLTPHLDPSTPAGVAEIVQATQNGQKTPAVMKILSGATYGSSFVALINIESTSQTDTKQSLTSVAASLQESMEVGSWFASVSGGFGVDSSFSNSAKQLLSTQQINAHASIVCMGVIPSIVANEVQVGVKQFADFDPAKMMGQLATLANATQADQASVAEAATRARTGAQMESFRNNEIKSVVSGLGELQAGKNKVIDINTAMTAFEDYIEKCIAGKAGVPITYYIKPIDGLELAKMWVNKYLPRKYVTGVGDGPGAETPAAPAASETPAAPAAPVAGQDSDPNS